MGTNASPLSWHRTLFRTFRTRSGHIPDTSVGSLHLSTSTLSPKPLPDLTTLLLICLALLTLGLVRCWTASGPAGGLSPGPTSAPDVIPDVNPTPPRRPDKHV